MFGEFSSKFAEACAAAPHLEHPSDRREHDRATTPTRSPTEGVDLYALTHNETSTGVAMQLRPAGRRRRRRARGGRRHLGSRRSALGLPPRSTCTTSHRRSASPADGGLWLAACSPAAVERIERIAASDRWRPASLDLGIALTNSRADQTYNTPAVATLIMLDAQLRWMNANGGLEWCAARSDQSAAIMYGWADAARLGDAVRHRSGEAFVGRRHDRSRRRRSTPTVVSSVLRANGVLDTDSYRKLGRNQLRVGMFPAIDPADVEALTHCIDHVVESIAA